LWRNIQKYLVTEAQYFEKDLKDAALPKLTGKLLSRSPALRPTTLVLAMDGDVQEVTLKLRVPLIDEAEPGMVVEFEGVPKEFTASPFMLTMDVGKGKIRLLPAPTKTK